MRYSRIVFPIVVAMVLFVGVSIARAVPVVITTAAGQGADAYVQGPNSDTTNRGTQGSIVLKNDTTANNFARKGYVRFDLSTLGSNATINSAQLQLTVSTNNLASGSFTVDVLGLDNAINADAWGETTINWSNAPANNTGSGFSFTSAADLLGSFAVASADGSGTTKTFSDTDLLPFLLEDTDSLVSFLLRRSGTNAGGSPSLAFATKENATLAPPTLLLDVTFVPEPASIAIWSLLGLVVGVGVWRRRRK